MKDGLWGHHAGTGEACDRMGNQRSQECFGVAMSEMTIPYEEASGDVHFHLVVRLDVMYDQIEMRETTCPRDQTDGSSRLGHDTGDVVQKKGLPGGVPEVLPSLDHRKSRRKKNVAVAYRPGNCRRAHHLRADAQALARKSRGAA
jgi:hypothetical protein